LERIVHVSEEIRLVLLVFKTVNERLTSTS